MIKRKVLATWAICAIYLQYPLINWIKINIVCNEGNLPNLFGPYYALPGYIAMTLLFVVLYKVELRLRPIEKVVTSVSLASYEMFLFSYLCDQLIYPLVMERFYTNQNSFIVWFIPVTLTILITSYILASIYRRVMGQFEANKK
ncbi:hypothetical protein DWW05_20830 [Bacteroides thetaiotaomicron]|nr:hypothetical protein DWW05_20830 [Bacteroides thetaiotaomicron]